MIETASQAVRSFENTDPAFHARMPLSSIYKPLLLLVLPPLFGFVTALGKHNLLDPQVFGELLVVCRL